MPGMTSSSACSGTPRRWSAAMSHRALFEELVSVAADGPRLALAV